MGEMKSAFEKAMEKAERLGKLSPEEMRKRAEEEYAPIGRAITERYLGHGHKQLLREGVERYSGDEKGMVIEAALFRLIEAIDFTSGDQIERALDGLITIEGEGRTRGTIEEIRGLLGEYKDVQKQKYVGEKERIEKDERELLHQLRISGSAMGAINLQASETWRMISREIDSQFNERLGVLKRELLDLLEKS
jgi:hypothetical protein